MNIFWRSSFVKFAWQYWTEFSQSWKGLRKILRSHENLQSLTDISGANIGIHSNSRDLLVVLNVHDVKNKSINEQERTVFERYVSSIFYLHKKQQKYDSKVRTYHCFTCITCIYLTRTAPCCADFTKCNVEHQKWGR